MQLTVEENPDGDRNLAPLLLYMTAGPAMGFTVANVEGRCSNALVKTIVKVSSESASYPKPLHHSRYAKRECRQSIGLVLGWLYDNGGLGILGELMYDTVQQADNGAYGQVRAAHILRPIDRTIF